MTQRTHVHLFVQALHQFLTRNAIDLSLLEAFGLNGHLFVDLTGVNEINAANFVVYPVPADKEKERKKKEKKERKEKEEKERKEKEKKEKRGKEKKGKEKKEKKEKEKKKRKKKKKKSQLWEAQDLEGKIK